MFRDHVRRGKTSTNSSTWPRRPRPRVNKKARGELGRSHNALRGVVCLKGMSRSIADTLRCSSVTPADILVGEAQLENPAEKTT